MVDVNKLLETVSLGVAYKEGRSIGPAKCSYIPREDSDLKRSAEISFSEIDSFVRQGLCRESVHEGYVNVVLTYDGKKRLLDAKDFDYDKWRRIHSRNICCENAIPTFCVCLVRTMCPTHGDKCHGTHD